MYVKLDDDDMKALCDTRRLRVLEYVKCLKEDPGDLEVANKLALECADLKQFEATDEPKTVVCGEVGQSKENHEHPTGFSHCIQYTEDVIEILNNVAKNALGSKEKAKLERYYQARSSDPIFRQNFIREYASARDVYLHRDDDRSALSYSLALISLLALAIDNLVPMAQIWEDGSTILGLIAIAFAVFSLLLTFAWLPQFFKSSMHKCKGRIDNMEEFYLYINRHTN